MTDGPELVSTTEAAREIGVSPSTLRSWATRYPDRVKSAFVAENGRYRWDLDELLRICKARPRTSTGSR